MRTTLSVWLRPAAMWRLAQRSSQLEVDFFKPFGTDSVTQKPQVQRAERSLLGSKLQKQIFFVGCSDLEEYGEDVNNFD